MFIEYTIHYRSVFFIQPHQLTSPQAAWEGIISNVYGWLSKKLGPLRNQLFSFREFTMSSPEGRDWENQWHSIRTERSEESHPPRLWACRYEHLDSEFPGRRWRVDVGVERMDDLSLRVGVQVAYGVRDGHIGDLPALPSPSVPEAVRYFMKGDSWDVRLGSLRLSPAPLSFPVGEVKSLWDMIRDPRRGGPIVVVAADYHDSYPLSLQALSRELTGIAVVCGLPYDTQAEQREVFPEAYLCFPGSVRVYAQKVDLDKVGDTRRHRFFPAQQIREQGAEQVRRWIVRSLIRQAAMTQPDTVFSPADVERAQRTERLAQIRRQIDELRDINAQTAGHQQMYTGLLNQQRASFEEIIASLELRNQELQDEALAEGIKREEVEKERDKLEETTGDLQYQLDYGYSATEINRLREENVRLTSALTVVGSMSALPETMRETAELANNLWANRIALTPKALDSAGDAACDEHDTLWAGLYHMAQTLWPLYFERSMSQNEMKSIFDAAAIPWKLARGEGAMTRQDAELRKIRTDVFEGKEIYFEPHIKYGTKAPKLLRIHFYVDKESRRLIIGHCGDHLDNRTTKA